MDYNDADITNNGVTIYFCVPYYGNEGCSLIKSCICKIKSICNKEQSINFRVLYDVTKIDSFCSTKDKTPALNQSFVAYEFVCSGCRANYVGTTERTLFERNVEHAWNDKHSVVTSILTNIMVFNICSILPN